MLRHGVMVPYHEDPRFTTEIIDVHTVYAGSATIAEHELTSYHDGLTKDYHGVSRWYYDCTMTFQFFGEAVTWLTVGLRLGLFVFHLKAQGTGRHCCDCQLELLTA